MHLSTPIKKDRTWKSNGYEFELTDIDMDSFVVKGISYDGTVNEIRYSEKNTIDQIVRYEPAGKDVYNIVSIEDNHKFYFDVNMHYINSMYEIEEVLVTTSIHTNYGEKEMFTDILTKPAVDGYIAPLPEGTKINSIYKAHGLDYIAIDFSEEMTALYELGAAIESTHLYAVVDTLCEFYNVDKIKLTINGEKYSSGHFYFEDDMIGRQQ